MRTLPVIIAFRRTRTLSPRREASGAVAGTPPSHRRCDDVTMPKTMVVVFAHPDDDAYGIAGTVALHAADPAFRFVLVLATDGEAGDIREGFPATQDTLSAVRRAEDAAAWQALGRVPDRHEWLGYPDGKLSDVPFDELVDRIAGILAEEQPDVVATFGPDGIFGHPDHITVPRSCGSPRARNAASDDCATA
jgi:LmbE family N-acetylglucosaminyl deacetylase